MNIVSMLALPLASCLMMTMILSYLGLHVIKREVIFIDIAVAQVAALGAIFAHMQFHVHGDSLAALFCAIGATLLMALFFAAVRRYITQLPIEATIGITYALVASGALFMIGKSTCGHTHIQEMLAGNLLWVDGRTLVWSAASFLLAGTGFFLCRKPFQAISDSYESAVENGRSVILWDFLFYALCGIVITFAVRLAGVVVVFCFLIIPAALSALFAERWRIRLFVAWAVGALASVAGLLFSQYLDFSAGVSVALFLGVLLVVCALWRKKSA